MKKPVLVFLFLSSSFVAKCQVLHLQEKTSSVSFTIRNFGLNVEGSFSRPEGTIVYDPTNPIASSFVLKIASNTIDTGIGLRDQHLKGDEYLDALHYPFLKFVSAGVSKTDSADSYTVTGYLTIKDTTKKVEIPVLVMSFTSRYTFQGHFTINRRDFGVGRNSLSLADEVLVRFEIVTTPPL
ncbi:MAG TPA: YceI family protein [Cyclobacteriaceae bacterium]|nr:YceI family protein [Cyclobacteriaceae bacterium]